MLETFRFAPLFNNFTYITFKHYSIFSTKQEKSLLDYTLVGVSLLKSKTYNSKILTMLVLSAAKASLELSRIWYWWWHAGGMLARKRVRVATRAWWRAGWQWWCPLCYDDGNASRALYSASASKLRLLVKAMRLVSCRHIVEAVVLNVAVVVARSSLAASNRQRLAHQQLLHSKIKRPLRFLQ